MLSTYLVYNTVVHLQNNPPENNVQLVLAESELPPKQSAGKNVGPVPTKSEPGYLRFGGNWLHIIFRRIVLGSISFRLNEEFFLALV